METGLYRNGQNPTEVLRAHSHLVPLVYWEKETAEWNEVGVGRKGPGHL